jgi:hypothetical protein
MLLTKLIEKEPGTAVKSFYAKWISHLDWPENSTRLDQVCGAQLRSAEYQLNFKPCNSLSYATNLRYTKFQGKLTLEKWFKQDNAKIMIKYINRENLIFF